MKINSKSYKILSYYARNKYITRQWVYEKPGRKRRRYCINPNKVRVVFIK